MATVSLSPVFKQQFFDLNGNPLASGSVYTYVAGTLIPLATYVDSTGISANTNPITLDAAGRADIWFPNNTYYKIVVKDVNGVVQYTEDNVSTNQSVISTNDLFNFMTPTQVSDAKGLTNTGSDMTVAIQTALSSGSSYIYSEPNCNYNISDTLNIPSGVTLNLNGSSLTPTGTISTSSRLYTYGNYARMSAVNNANLLNATLAVPSITASSFVGSTSGSSSTLTIASTTVAPRVGMVLFGTGIGILVKINSFGTYNGTSGTVILSSAVNVPSSTTITGGPLGLSGYPASAVSIDTSSTNCSIKGCTFSYTGGNICGAVINASDYNEISECYSLAPILYTYAGGNYNRVFNNTISGGNAVSAQLSGFGNGGGGRLLAYGNVVKNNTCIYPTAMGIVDQSQGPSTGAYLIGTQIVGNTIISNTVQQNYSAISAIAQRTIVSENVIINWNGTAQAIEISGGQGTVCSNNIVSWDEQSSLVRTSATGCIIVNWGAVQASPPTPFIGQTIISNNQFAGAKTGVLQFNQGNVRTYGTTVTNNVFTNCSQAHICNIYDPVIFSNNQVNINYDKSAQISSNIIEVGNKTIANENHIVFGPSYVAPGTGSDTVFFIQGVDNSTIQNNIIDSSVVTTGNSIYATGTNGQNIQYVNFSFNQMLGSTLITSYQNFLGLIAEDNIVVGGSISGNGNFALEQSWPRTVATLPTHAPVGTISFVTDANATTFNSIVAAGGSNNVPVHSDGTNWLIG